MPITTITAAPDTVSSSLKISFFFTRDEITRDGIVMYRRIFITGSRLNFLNLAKYISF
ncbi:MAG: hypothetical protein HZB79_08305 [Deltaproteobacteria bacterium]|nr:hypothetical protein [Deltaproteobacteria bacterium]